MPLQYRRGNAGIGSPPTSRRQVVVGGKAHLRRLLASLALLMSLLGAGLIAPSPAAALDDWYWSECESNVMYAWDHAGGYNFWHTDFPWDFNGYNVNHNAGSRALVQYYWDFGGDCGHLGFPVTNMKWFNGSWYQDFNCGYLMTYGQWNQYVYRGTYTCIFAT